MFLNQRDAEFSISTPSAPPLTYTFKLTRRGTGAFHRPRPSSNSQALPDGCSSSSTRLGKRSERYSTFFHFSR